MDKRFPQVRFVPGRSSFYLFPLILIFGCARLSPESAVEQSSPLLERIDLALNSALKDYLPDPAQWPPREMVNVPEGFPVRLVQSVPASSLAFFPRLAPRLEAALREEGFDDFALCFFKEDGQDHCSLEVRVSEELSYKTDFYQTVRGRVALIIDDVGYSMDKCQQLLGLDYPLTVAVLPRMRHSSEWTNLAASRGFEVILHCPLEAITPTLDAGPGSIDCDIPEEELSSVFEDNIRDVPLAVGVNNHMGSAFTTHTRAMRTLFQELKERGLFFVDSLTIAGTVTPAVAEETGVRYVSRDIFLDHENNEELIARQLTALKNKALKCGFAVGIGHYRRLTLEVLARELPSLGDEGIQIVPVSDLIH